MLDIPTEYCERLSHLLGPEPLNVLSNVAFLLAASFAYRAVRSHELKSVALPILLSAVGIASAWWHLFHTRTGDIADTLSIFLFACVAGVLFLYKTFSSKVRVTVFALVTTVLVLGGEQVRWLNGSMPYVVVLLALGLAGMVYAQKFPSKRLSVLLMFSTFLLALTLRSLDSALCSFIPIGTHFLWHILVAFFGYQIILLVVHKPESRL